jgi:hypothetical protein
VVLVVRALLLMLAVGALAIVVSACTAAQQSPATQAPQAPAVATVTATATVGTHTATATATATATPHPIVPCTEEDGSAPGQAFPCAWAGGPNGLGRTYTLTEPVCSVYQVALADSQHAQGDPVDVDCDDLESQTGAF